MYKPIISFIISLILLNIPSFSQAQAPSLNEETRQALQNRVKAKVEDFTGLLGDIVNQKLSQKVRLECVNAAKALFIGNCEPYQLEENGVMVNHRAVYMQTSSINSSKKSNQLMSRYLMRQYEMGKAYRVEIEAIDAIRVDNIYKVGDHYECMAYWGQKYMRLLPDGRYVYGDFTKKGVRCYITAVEVPGSETIFEISLGDVYALETTSLRR